LLDWLTSLFIKRLSFEIACRIWDNFFLDGEVYLFRTGLALLSYFESKLIKEGHAGIKLLMNRMQEEIDEDRLFKLIDRVILIKEE